MNMWIGQLIDNLNIKDKVTAPDQDDQWYNGQKCSFISQRITLHRLWRMDACKNKEMIETVPGMHVRGFAHNGSWRHLYLGWRNFHSHSRLERRFRPSAVVPRRRCFPARLPASLPPVPSHLHHPDPDLATPGTIYRYSQHRTIESWDTETVDME